MYALSSEPCEHRFKPMDHARILRRGSQDIVPDWRRLLPRPSGCISPGISTNFRYLSCEPYRAGMAFENMSLKPGSAKSLAVKAVLMYLWRARVVNSALCESSSTHVGQIPLQRILFGPYSAAITRVIWACAPFDIS